MEARGAGVTTESTILFDISEVQPFDPPNCHYNNHSNVISIAGY